MKKGFTLIELLVAMAIIGILAATAIVNFGKNADRDVRLEKERLTSFIREVQNRAIAGDRENVSLGSGEKLCGYGLNQQGDSKIQAYYITAPNLNADCSASAVSKTYDSNHKLDAFNLNNSVKISGTFSDIFFLIPDGVVYEGNAKLVSPDKIDISLTTGSVTLNPAVSVEEGGRIY